MNTCLTKSDISLHAKALEREFKRIEARVSKRSKAKQWDFFRHCFQVLLDGQSKDFNCGKTIASYYKLRISKKLKDHYTKDNYPLSYSFRLEHAKLKKKYFEQDEDYPSANGYLLLVTRPKYASKKPEVFVYGAVEDAIAAEYAIYQKLPQVNLKPLKHFFAQDGPAYREIRSEAKRHRKSNEIISNPGNPSTKAEIKGYKIVRIDEASAEMMTEEHWNLHWWSTTKKDYVKPWRGKNEQHYTLIKRNESWLVWENVFRPPE